jgi:hypothetical protein
MLLGHHELKSPIDALDYSEKEPDDIKHWIPLNSGIGNLYTGLWVSLRYQLRNHIWHNSNRGNRDSRLPTLALSCLCMAAKSSSQHDEIRSKRSHASGFQAFHAPIH